LATVLGEPGDRRLLDVVGRDLDELRLAWRRAGPAGQIEIGQREVRLEAARGEVEGGARYAHALRLRPERAEALGEGCVGGGGRDGECEEECCGNRGDLERWRHLLLPFDPSTQVTRKKAEHRSGTQDLSLLLPANPTSAGKRE